MFIDTHSHIDFEDFEDVELVLSNAEKNGVKKIIIPGVEPDTFERIIKLVEKYDNLYGAIGVHPSEAQKYNDNVENIIAEYAKHPKIVAIGEIGLDYYWDKSFIELQKEIFINQIEIANKVDKPILIHEREAHMDSFEILAKYARTNVVMHCFSGSPEFAKMCVNKGYYLSFGGIITFKNAKNPKNVVKNINLENMLLETDAPFLTPEPHRGTRNEPAYVKLVAEQIAILRETDVETVANITTKNADKIFSWSTN